MIVSEFLYWVGVPLNISAVIAMNILGFFAFIFISIAIFLFRVLDYLRKINHELNSSPEQRPPLEISAISRNNYFNYRLTNPQVIAQSDLPPQYEPQLPPPSYYALFAEEIKN